MNKPTRAPRIYNNNYIFASKKNSHTQQQQQQYQNTHTFFSLSENNEIKIKKNKK